MSGPPVPAPGQDDGVLRPTGHGRVDAVLARAAELDAAELAEHPRLHEQLHAALAAELEAEPGTVPAGLVPRQGPGTP